MAGRQRHACRSASTMPAPTSAALKAFLAPTMTGMINTPNEWDPAANNWYGMLWQGAGSPGADGKTDPTSGQESILGAFSGQIIRQATFAGFRPDRGHAEPHRHLL